MRIYLLSPNMPSWLGAQLKYRDNFTLPLRVITFDLVIDIFILNGSLLQ
jgi:hypothetical protein